MYDNASRTKHTYIYDLDGSKYVCIQNEYLVYDARKQTVFVWCALLYMC